MPNWSVLLGSLVIAFTLREVFRDLFHPTASGSLSDFIASGIFNVFRHIPRLLTDAGPLAIVLVILTWALSVCVGFALVYWGVPPTDFKIESGQPPAGFPSMLYFSLEVLTTLGLGDYAPVPIWLRLIASLEALVGFGVLTASISSIVLLHMALGRIRTLSRRVSQLMRADSEVALSFETDGTEELLLSLASDVARTRVDLIQFPLVYYFYSDQHHAALPKVLPYLLRLAEGGLIPDKPLTIRRAAAVLLLALRDLADTLRERFLKVEGQDCAAIFEAYAQHHRPA
jgi:ion channel